MSYSLVSATDLAVIFGVPIADVLASAVGVTDGSWRVPDDWARDGRRRIREAQAATGSTDLQMCIAYLADRASA